MPNRRLHCLCIFLQLIILAFFPFVGHVSALDKVTSPWYIQNDPIPLFLNPDAHILQTVKHENEYYIFTGLNNSNVIEIYRAQNIDLRFSTGNSLATDTIASSIISFWNISLSNWTFDPERRWSTVSFTINPSTSLYRLYAVALSSTAGLRIQSYALGNRSSLSQQNYPIAGIENTHIVLDWKWGALMVGLYQHAPPTQSRSNISYIGAYTDEGRRIVEKYNYSRPFFLHSMALNSSASTNFYQITIVNDTHVTDLVPNSGQFTPSARSTQSLPDEHLIRGFPLYGYDISTNTSYYLSRRPRIDSTEIWLQKFNQNGIYLQHVTLPVNFTTSSKFQTDMKLSNGFIYAAVVTESTLLDCNRECGKAGQSELHLLQYNQTDLSLTSKLILATAGDNIISRIDIDNTTGALDMIWMSKDTVKRNTTLNYFRFSPFKISDVLVADSNSTRMTENSTLRIMFSVLPERLQLIKLTAVPTVYVGKKISPYVRWNNDSLEASVPRGVGTGLSIMVEFPYLPHKPNVEASTKFSYEPPQIMSVVPRVTPIVGGSRLEMMVDNIDDMDDLAIRIGENKCTDIVILGARHLGCIIPPGQIPGAVPIVVSAGGQTSVLNITITYYEPMEPIAVAISEAREKTKISLSRCPDFIGQSARMEYRMVSVPGKEVGNFEQSVFGNRSPVRMWGNDVIVLDQNGSIWYEPSDSFHGTFDFDYYCRDTNENSTTNRITVELSVPPRLDCQPEVLINDNITLTTTDLIKDGLWLKISSGPRRGNLLNPANDSLIDLEKPFQVNALRYMANFSVEQNRSFFPTDEITYYVENNDNRRSKACKLRFSVFCAPHVLNVFNRTSHRVCTECPNNANCSTNGLYAPIPNRGNWMSTNGVVLSCVSEKACPGTSDEMCGVGYTGIRCGDCSQGFYKLNKECLPCRGDYTIIIIILTGVLVGGAIVVSIVIRFAENGPSLGFAITFINFIQMISIVRELNLKWTQDFHTTVNGVSFFMFNPELLSPECFFPVQNNSYSLKFRLILAIPLALVALLLFFAACNSRLVRVPLCMAKAALSWCVGRGFTPPDAVSLQRRQNEMYFALWRGFNTALSFIYLIVASQSLSFFDCTEEGDGHHYLDSDPSLRCYEPWWQENLILAWLGVSLYVIGIPLYFFAIFYFFYQEKHRAAFFLRLKKICKEAISQNVYVKPEYQFLIFVQILLKFMVISIQQFFTRYAALQVLLMLFVCFISYVFYYGHTPYSYRSLNSLESLSSVSSAGILAIGLLLFTEQFRSEEQKFYLTATLLTIMATFVAATMAAVAYEFAVSYKSKSVKGGKQPKRKVLVLAASRVQLIGQDV